jgi:F0F1-type ATP synthase membrane subunit a
LEAIADAATWMLYMLVPCAALSVAGIMLWRRWHSAATAMIAFGFGLTFIVLVASLFAPIKTHAVFTDFTSAPSAPNDLLCVAAHYKLVSLPAVGLIGMCTAALGTLWHVIRER